MDEIHPRTETRGVHLSTHKSAVDRETLATPATAIGAVAFGALALGATAMGALAIGRLAVGAFAVKRGRRQAAWSYRQAYAEVSRIADFVSFEPDIVSVQIDGMQIDLEPGQTVIPHGPDRELTVAKVLPRKEP